MRVNVSLPEDLILVIDRYCQKYGFNRSELIRRALRVELGSQPAVPTTDDEERYKTKLEKYDAPFPVAGPIQKKSIAKAISNMKAEKCPHFISRGGMCSKCPGGIAR